MSVLASWLLAVGVADLVRAMRRDRGGRAQGWAVASALTVLVAVALLAGLTTATDLGLLTLAAAAAVVWLLVSHRGLTAARGELAALGCFAATAAVLVLLSGWASPVGGPIARWLEWTAVPRLPTSPDKALLAVGLFAAQLSTGNALVRLVLTQVGSIRPSGGAQPSDRLRGGRLLGPMERVFILGLGLAGQVTAASLVIAAKGLLRFPELQGVRQRADEPARSRVARRVLRVAAQRDARRPGIDDITEYFLVGSFVSWLVALASLALMGLV